MQTGETSDLFEALGIDPDDLPTSSNAEITAMMRLFQSVVLQAVQDVKTMSAKPEVESARSEGIAFFDRRGRWGFMYEVIVLYAGWNPDDLQERYRKWLSRSLVDYLALHQRKRCMPARTTSKRRAKKNFPRFNAPFSTVGVEAFA